MLAVDPFTQQIIRYYNCSRPINDHRATIPRTNVCLDVAGDGDPGGNIESVSPGFQDAINSGIYSPGGHVTPSCATGNCSFSHSYNTLAFCSSCTDFTDQVQLNSSSSPIGTFIAGAPNYTMIRLPSGTHITTGALDSAPSVDVATMNITSSVQVEFLFVSDPTAVPGVLANQTPKSTCNSENGGWPCKGYGAAVCTISRCIRTYTGAISLGNFDEKRVADWNGTIWGLGKPAPIFLPVQGTIDTECITPPERKYLVDAGYQLDPDVRWLPYNLTFDPSLISNSSPPSSILQHGCLYALYPQDIDGSWSRYLGTYFNGTLTEHLGIADDQPTYYDGPQSLQQIYNHGAVTFESLNSTFRNLSESLTTYLRQSCNTNHSNPAVGSVMHDETCLQVRWAWLAFPAALVLATVLFFIATVITTRPKGERSQIWKSSPLALLLHGLQEPIHQNVIYERVQEMERVAENTTVRLATTEHGTNLVAVGRETDDDGKERGLA